MRISDWSSDVCSSDLRVRPRARRADEAQRLVEHIEHRRHDERAEDHADDQRDLLLPRRRADELAGLEVLEIVVRDRRDTEHKPGDDRSEEYTSALQSIMRRSYAVYSLRKKKNIKH